MPPSFAARLRERLWQLRMASVYVTNGLRAKRYESYLHVLLDHYLPPTAKAAESVLDAMCGRVLPNLRALRSYFPEAKLLGVDIDVHAAYSPPKGAYVKKVDILRPVAMKERYALVALFKPPTAMLEERLHGVLGRILGLVAPGGHLLIIVLSREEGLLYTDCLRQLGATVTTSEANRFHAAIEPEHDWVIVVESRPSEPSRPTG